MDPDRPAPAAPRPQSPSRPDELVRALSDDGSVSVRAVVGTGLVEHAREVHGLSPTATHALGRLLMGAALVAAGAKTDETLQIRIQGDGPLGTLLAIADSQGGVRGTVGRPDTHLRARAGRAAVAEAIGEGVLSVVRHHPRWRQPYTGITPLSNGEVASDIARYLTESEQTPSAVGLGVALDDVGRVAAAGGFLVQAMPGADDDVLAVVERSVRAIDSPAEMVRSGARGDDLVDILLQGVGTRGRVRAEVRYRCPCSPERVSRAVLALGRAELERVVADGETLEARCEFCGTRYEVPPREVERQLAGG